MYEIAFYVVGTLAFYITFKMILKSVAFAAHSIAGHYR